MYVGKFVLYPEDPFLDCTFGTSVGISGTLTMSILSGGVTSAAQCGAFFVLSLVLRDQEGSSC